MRRTGEKSTSEERGRGGLVVFSFLTARCADRPLDLLPLLEERGQLALGSLVTLARLLDLGRSGPGRRVGQVLLDLGQLVFGGLDLLRQMAGLAGCLFRDRARAVACARFPPLA